MQLERGLLLLPFAVFLPHAQTHKHTHTHRDRFLEFLVIMLAELGGKPSAVQEPGPFVSSAGCTGLRGFVPVCQTRSVLRAEAVGQVVAFCKQVKIHCKILCSQPLLQ